MFNPSGTKTNTPIRIPTMKSVSTAQGRGIFRDSSRRTIGLRIYATTIEKRNGAITPARRYIPQRLNTPVTNINIFFAAEGSCLMNTASYHFSHIKTRTVKVHDHLDFTLAHFQGSGDLGYCDSLLIQIQYVVKRSSRVGKFRKRR